VGGGSTSALQQRGLHPRDCSEKGKAPSSHHSSAEALKLGRITAIAIVGTRKLTAWGSRPSFLSARELTL
jgi:hypothetical protein